MSSGLFPTTNVRFYTLGCKVNQYETQAIREAMEKKGACDIEGQKGVRCDLVVLNTCTVTEDSDRTNRYWIRRLRREHPAARIVVTGCYAERNRKEIESMAEVDAVFPNEDKAVLAERLLGGTVSVAPAPGSFLPLSVSRSEGHTRAYVKIQDGCNHVCSFCKVTLVRGSSRSRALSEIREEVLRLRDAGYREIILTGIQLGAYGLDFRFAGSTIRLRDVIESCAEVDGIERVRLGSIEITDVGAPIVAAFREIPKFCPHLHIPLQSGDNEVLRRMNRSYTREFYLETIRRLQAQVPDFALSLDVMAGFPGETEEQFENSVELLRSVRPLKTHVFPYSRREGTRAADWPCLPPAVVKDRVRKLIVLAERIAEEVRGSYFGRTLRILGEEKEKDAEFSNGRAANYLKVFFKYPRPAQGCIITLRLEKLYQDGVFGTAVD
ncbi:MAG TPA: tRNA (N(6)-L-threonylcarbamoyladenosine(37)-C(2))-methylthiotransferase MtaB [Candidatus Omnitrophota bacterium]|nr:tRNA (N(6)-L-threonylcarbamoyladenosine(37)-C(2))-methylthiotransferase MtaB [Candidatus Omnitrophota bacterium]HPS37655.1 tRNA (N(6)-L-threonylcarbamoyladenosine(37)-C(2))-methylthiotransferase MtaB [Candidatus Omnitrophota bacterium]